MFYAFLKSSGHPLMNVLFCLAVNGAPWGGEAPRQKSHTFNCRMLVNYEHGQSHGLPEDRPGGQRYETMQCFALTQPRAMMEEGEGKHNCLQFVKTTTKKKDLLNYF